MISFTRLAAGIAMGGALAVSITGVAQASPRTTPVGKKLAVLKGSGENSYFGSAVAISGQIAVVGDGEDSSATDAPLGHIYIFTKSAAGWKQVARLTGSNGFATNEFAQTAIAISGTTVVVGAPGGGSTGLPGAVYVFSRIGGVWKQAAELKGPAGSTTFGSAVSMSGSTIVATGDIAATDDGAAWVFTKTAGGWKQAAELGPADAGFGRSVAVSGTTMVVGDTTAAVGAGRAFVFTKTAPGWKQAAEIKGSDTRSDGFETTSDHFGWSVTITGATIVVGAPLHADYRGAVYEFGHRAAKWKQTAELKGAVAGIGTTGSGLGASGKTLITNIVTHAYLFTGSSGHWKRTELKTPYFDMQEVVGLSGSVALVAVPAHPTGTKGKTAPAEVDVFEA
jgi:hypothetical protein